MKLSKTLKNLLEAAGSKDTVLFDVDVEACKVEIEQTQQMLQEYQKQHNEAIAKAYKQLSNLLPGDLQSQLGCVCRKMHKRDLWAGEKGQVTVGRHPHMWTSFRDCLELHKLTVFSADAAKRQQFYIQQAVRKPQRATLEHIFRMGLLIDYLRYLPMLKDSPKAVPMMKKGNIPFGEADLAAILLTSVSMTWQNQYNLNQTTVLESTGALLLNLEAIEPVMVDKKHNKKLKAKGKAATARHKAKSNPKNKVSGGPTGQVLKKGCSEKFCQHCKFHGSPYQTHNTLDCRCYDSNGKPLKAAAGKPS